MKRSITRRDILKMTGGGIVGMILSPLPWKVLDDSAIWTQNWERTPKLSHGPITSRFANCSLCNAGCGMMMKCIDGVPYYVRGVREHPITGGSLCARGITGHHMANHPLRIVHPHSFTSGSETGRLNAVSRDEAINAIIEKIRVSQGTIAILDQQQGRAITTIYRDFLSRTRKGILLDSPAAENRTLHFTRSMSNDPAADFGYDLEHSTLVLSFGAPLFDGWGIPGRMSALINSGNIKFIQIEDRRSRTALQANEWISIVPGMERYLALSIANVLLRDNLISRSHLKSIQDLAAFERTAEQFSPEATAPFTGITAERVRMLAQELATSPAPIVLSGADAGGGPFDDETERLIAALNILIDSVGRSGGIVTKRPLPGSVSSGMNTSWESIPDHSIEVLIIDSADSGNALPWRLLEQKLVVKDRCIVTLSPVLNGISAHSDLLIPAPGHLESLTESPSTESGSVSIFSFTLPAMPPREYCVEPIDLIRELSSRLYPDWTIPTQEESLRQRCESIHSSNRGSVFSYSDRQRTAVSEFPTADDLWKALSSGAIWLDDPAEQIPIRSFSLRVPPTVLPPSVNTGLKLIAHGWKGTTSSSQMSPLMSKIFQESELRSLNGTVSLFTGTAAAAGLVKDDVAVVTTVNGSMKVRVKVDPNIPASMVLATIGPSVNGKETPLDPSGPNILDLCEVNSNGTWRSTSVELKKA